MDCGLFYRAEAKSKIELEVVDFSEYNGLTLATVKINMTESHFNNDLLVEADFARINDKYAAYDGSGVFGRTFKMYSKNSYNSKLEEVVRVLPKKKIVVNDSKETTEADPMDTLRL